nr:type II toxin-antitoxin system RelE/ParE family toxin [Brasilonema bromeliae]
MGVAVIAPVGKRSHFLKTSDHEYRIRVGDYRVRYEIDDESQLVQLLQCKHRKDVYRK